MFTSPLSANVLPRQNYFSTLPSTLRNVSEEKPVTSAVALGGDAKPLQKSTDNVSVSQNALALLQQDVQQRTNVLEDRAIGFAQQLLDGFARQLFGNNANDFKVSFTSASVSASSSYSASIQQSSDQNGSTQSQNFSLTESSHFSGKGQITTADGRTFDFFIDLQLDAKIEGLTTSTQTNQASSVPPTTSSRPPKELEHIAKINFPGHAQDLFKLIDHLLQSTGNKFSKTDDLENGSAALRLKGLVQPLQSQLPAASKRSDEQILGANQQRLKHSYSQIDI